MKKEDLLSYKPIRREPVASVTNVVGLPVSNHSLWREELGQASLQEFKEHVETIQAPDLPLKQESQFAAIHCSKHCPLCLPCSWMEELFLTLDDDVLLKFSFLLNLHWVSGRAVEIRRRIHGGLAPETTTEFGYKR